MPGLAHSGNVALRDEFNSGAQRELYRVYVTTDVDCVNVVYRGSITGAPAWAPRTTSGLVLPGNTSELLRARDAWIVADGKNGKTFSVENAPITENESLKEAASGGSGSGGSGGSGDGGASDKDKVEDASLDPPLVDLWDNGWPENRYFYTVVPVRIRPSAADPNVIEYQDTELPQDVCAAGRVFTFGKVSEAVVATAGAAPYVSASAPAVASSPRVARSRRYTAHPSSPGGRRSVRTNTRCSGVARRTRGRSMARSRRPRRRRTCRWRPAAGTTACVASRSRCPQAAGR